ncbi:hypothetical protein [Amycolatopsis sp. cmx-4-61]|uniref:hypothetical protein n=1 Tax=Amycolatopsis sp. cmx-4-61 TaxID=2790937 RepID=UPI00397D620B
MTAIVSLGLVTWCGLVAPPAQATTTTSCPSATQPLYPFNAVGIPASCAGFPDQGAPYVFRIGSLYAWRLVGLDILLVGLGPATLSCTAYRVQADGSLLATGCTYVR